MCICLFTLARIILLACAKLFPLVVIWALWLGSKANSLLHGDIISLRRDILWISELHWWALIGYSNYCLQTCIIYLYFNCSLPSCSFDYRIVWHVFQYEHICRRERSYSAALEQRESIREFSEMDKKCLLFSSIMPGGGSTMVTFANCLLTVNLLKRVRPSMHGCLHLLYVYIRNVSINSTIAICSNDIITSWCWSYVFTSCCKFTSSTATAATAICKCPVISESQMYIPS